MSPWSLLASIYAVARGSKGVIDLPLPEEELALPVAE